MPVFGEEQQGLCACPILAAPQLGHQVGEQGNAIFTGLWMRISSLAQSILMPRGFKHWRVIPFRSNARCGSPTPRVLANTPAGLSSTSWCWSAATCPVDPGPMNRDEEQRNAARRVDGTSLVLTLTTPIPPTTDLPIAHGHLLRHRCGPHIGGPATKIGNYPHRNRSPTRAASEHVVLPPIARS